MQTASVPNCRIGVDVCRSFVWMRIKRARRILQHDDLGANGRTIVEINNILVGEAYTTGGNVLADGPRFVGAVNPIEGVFVALPQIQSASAKWIGKSSDHSRSALQI